VRHARVELTKGWNGKPSVGGKTRDQGALLIREVHREGGGLRSPGKLRSSGEDTSLRKGVRPRERDREAKKGNAISKIFSVRKNLGQDS